MRFPRIAVDWDAVERALTAGPPAERGQAETGTPSEPLQWLELERASRHWTARAEPHHRGHAVQPRDAERVLALW